MVERRREVEDIRRRAAEVRDRIAAAGGDPDRVTVVGVTKAFPAEVARWALAAGIVDLGENYAQELEAKAEALAPSPVAPRWHFIGGLQRNKVKRLAGTVWLWQTIDRAVLVDEVAKRSPGDRVMIQVNTTDEPQKSGCRLDEVEGLVDRGRATGLDVVGLMTVGPTSSEVDPRPSFELLRELASKVGVTELSMGMSADYELAVAEGATMIRIGTVLFGPRPTGPRTTAGR